MNIISLWGYQDLYHINLFLLYQLKVNLSTLAGKRERER